jgi:hypothetical protein
MAKMGIFGGRRRGKAPWQGFRAGKSQKILKKPWFSAFFFFTSDCVVPYDRIDKEEIEHFRIVLFLCIPWVRTIGYTVFFPDQIENIGRF